MHIDAFGADGGSAAANLCVGLRHFCDAHHVGLVRMPGFLPPQTWRCVDDEPALFGCFHNATEFSAPEESVAKNLPCCTQILSLCRQIVSLDRSAALHTQIPSWKNCFFTTPLKMPAHHSEANGELSCCPLNDQRRAALTRWWHFNCCPQAVDYKGWYARIGRRKSVG